jgi:MoxR-like ATPase
MRRVFTEIKRVIVGQDKLIERLLVALLARGHILLEGVPGLAKTLAIKTIAQVVGGTFRRIQFTPDLVPADLVGTRIYNQRTGEFTVELGPVFANLLLADEINRAAAVAHLADHAGAPAPAPGHGRRRHRRRPRTPVRRLPGHRHAPAGAV